MATYRGVVKNGVIFLSEDVRLPDGTVVEVRVTDDPFERVLAHRRMNAAYFVGIDEVLSEDRREREARMDEWLGKP